MSWLSTDVILELLQKSYVAITCWELLTDFSTPYNKMTHYKCNTHSKWQLSYYSVFVDKLNEHLQYFCFIVTVSSLTAWWKQDSHNWKSLMCCLCECLCVCIHICVYVFMYVSMHIHICMCVYSIFHFTTISHNLTD